MRAGPAYGEFLFIIAQLTLKTGKNFYEKIVNFMIHAICFIALALAFCRSVLGLSPY